jgi:hypothetical protein
MKKVWQYLFVFIVISSTTLIVYSNRNHFVLTYENLLIYSNIRKPCSLPIYYYINNFDNRFNVDKSQFIDLLKKSAEVWNVAQKNDLLVYDEAKAKNISDYSHYKLPINLIYDKRQETTNSLNKINTDIESGKQNLIQLNIMKKKSIMNLFLITVILQIKQKIQKQNGLFVVMELELKLLEIQKRITTGITKQ